MSVRQGYQLVFLVHGVSLAVLLVVCGVDVVAAAPGQWLRWVTRGMWCHDGLPAAAASCKANIAIAT
jgi:hypothetical protein